MSQRGVFYGWVVLAAAATVIAVGMGALFSLAVFLKPIEDSMHWSRSAISLVALINWIAMGLGSFVWGALSDRIGGRVVAAAGGFVLGLGLVLSSQVATRSEEHTSELQSPCNLVCRLLLEKKKNTYTSHASCWLRGQLHASRTSGDISRISVEVSAPLLERPDSAAWT